MAKYRTALGKVVDMSALSAKNEKTRAVGNMKVNARGDTIDSAGRVIKSATSTVNENYAKTVGNKSAQALRKPAAPDPVTQAQARAKNATPVHGGVNSRIDPSELSAIEKDLDQIMEDDIEVEQIKAKETSKKNG